MKYEGTTDVLLFSWKHYNLQYVLQKWCNKGTNKKQIQEILEGPLDWRKGKSQNFSLIVN